MFDLRLRRSWSRRGALIVCTAVLLTVIGGANLATVWRLHRNVLVDVQSDLLRQSLTLSELAERTLQSVDLMLVNTVEKARAMASSGDRQLRSQGTYRLLRERVLDLPQIDTLGILDAGGHRLNHSRAWPDENIDLSSRDYFQGLKQNPALKSFISEPARGTSSGAWVVTVARPILSGDGKFLGVVFATMRMSYFEQLLRSTALGEGYAASLMRDDGTLLARYPAAGKIGNKAPASVLQIMGRARSALSRAISPVDQQARIAAAYRLAEHPLVVVATENEDAALADWRKTALSMGGISAALIVIIVLSASLIDRSWKQQERLNAAHAEIGESTRIRALAEAELNRRRDLADQNVHFAAALENMAHGLCMFDREQRLIACNKRYGELYGLIPEQIRVGTSLGAILEARVAAGQSPEDANTYIQKRIEEVTKGEAYYAENELRSGRCIAVSHEPMQNGGWVAIHQDITEQRRTQARVAYMASHDPLTGLANRASFIAKLEEAAASRRRGGECFSVLMLDLDHFKVVNDSIGHAGGDTLLQEVGRRLRSSLRETDMIARLGGDEFAIVQIGDPAPVGDQRQRASAIELATRIMDVLRTPFTLDDFKANVGVSIGIALAPQDGTDPSELLKKADLALYRTKAGGRDGFTFFDPDMMLEVQSRHQLAHDMGGGLVRNEFELHYQPVVGVATRATLAAEALVRWRHPEKGLLSPDSFIPLAEETGFIEELGTWILRKACTDAASWPTQVKLAVNISPVQFRRGNLYDVVVSALAEAELSAERLEIEITESVLLDRHMGAKDLLRKLKGIGITIVLDDFGTGFSSLSYVTRFPVGKIKIDKSFTQGLAERQECVAVIASVVTLARALDLATTAEGVETEEQFTLLKAAGVTHAQGHLFGQARPICELTSGWLGQEPPASSAA